MLIWASNSGQQKDMICLEDNCTDFVYHISLSLLGEGLQMSKKLGMLHASINNCYSLLRTFADSSAIINR